MASQRSTLKRDFAIGIGLGVLSIASVLTLVTLSLIGPESAPVIGMVLFLAGFLGPHVVVARLGARRFKREWEEKQQQDPLTTSSQSTPPASEAAVADENEQITEITKQLVHQLGLTGFSPGQVLWQTMVPQGNSFQFVTSDNCLVRGNQLFFGGNMRGRLAPEEWRPIIASSLIYYKKFRRKITERLLIWIFPIIALYTLAWFILPSFFPTTVTGTFEGRTAVNNWGWVILIFGGPILVILAIPFVSRYLGRMKLVADREAAEIVGTGAFMDTLRKIAENSPSDRVSIAKRVNNLQSKG